MAHSSLISNVTSEARHQANLLTNTPDLVKVLVEDEEDVVVWYRFLKTFAPDFSFEVSPYSYDSSFNGKGKANILKMAGNFGKNLLGCIDSDFDWLLEDWTTDGQTIKHNQYILQTYAYSVENLASQPYGDSDWMLECVMHSCQAQNDLDKDYSVFIGSISSSVYEVLLWHLLMWKDRIDVDEIAKGWDYVFGNDHYNDILTDHALTVEGQRHAVLNLFQERSRQIVDDYDRRYSVYRNDYEVLKKDLADKYKLSPENAYLFVRGHNLHDFLMHCFFNPIRNSLIIDHKNEIRSHNVGIEIQNQINHYNKHITAYKRDHLHKTAYIEDQTNVLTSTIGADIERILN
ncbi:MAG: DUF4435 domain-containing protein [Muribaculaceae bacterium]|nr:DUF4435 domain-containing protein [Muribaculaceae bacterium]